MSSKAIPLPTKVDAIIIVRIYILPVLSIWYANVGVGGHTSERDDCLLVGDIGPRYVINGPC
jgi:hypothetical protein